MITEEEIDAFIDRLSKEDNLEQEIKLISDEEPFLAAFLHTENHSLLSKDEYSLLWFLTVVVYKTFTEQYPNTGVLQAEDIEEKEEKIWELLNDSKEKTFRGKLDTIFELCPEEDLLAFIEDSLVADEDSVVTNAGREFVFVAAATLLFCLSL